MLILQNQAMVSVAQEFAKCWYHHRYMKWNCMNCWRKMYLMTGPWWRQLL